MIPSNFQLPNLITVAGANRLLTMAERDAVNRFTTSQGSRCFIVSNAPSDTLASAPTPA